MSTNIATQPPYEDGELHRTLGLFSAAAIVAGSMIGSGIFLVTPDAARYVDTAGLLVALWIFTGIMTLLGAASYGKLAAHLPEAGGQYVFLREAWGRIPAFLYGWVFFLVVQTGFLAAVSVAFARYVGVLVPMINTDPLFPLLGDIAMTSEKLLAIGCLVVLTVYNSLGIKYGAFLQNVFTSMKVLALLILIIVGLAFGQNLWGGGAELNWSLAAPAGSTGAEMGFLAMIAIASVGPLFSSDAWNYVTFIGGEVKNPHKVLPKALIYGTLTVVILYLLANLAYINVLSMEAIKTVPDDKVAAVMMSTLFGDTGSTVIALIILVSTFGCLNGLLLAGARVFYSMAKDRLLFHKFGEVNPKTKSPNFSLWAQCLWAILLALSGTYIQLLGYIVFTSLVFYIVTMAGLLKLARRIPDEVNMKTPFDYAIPILYIAGASLLAWYMLFQPETWNVFGTEMLVPIKFTSVAGVGLTLVGLPVYFIWKKLTHKPV